MKRPAAAAAVAVAVAWLALATSPAAAAPDATAGVETGTVSGAIQVGPKLVLVSVPNPCFDPADEGQRRKVERWLDAIRLYRLPKSRLDPTTPEKLTVEAEAAVFENCIFEVRLTTEVEIGREDDYRVVVDGLDVDPDLRLVPGTVDLAPRKLTLELDRTDPFKVEVATPSCRAGDEASYRATASITVAKPGLAKPVDEPAAPKVVGRSRTGDAPGPCRLTLRFDAPLRHGMKLTVTGDSPIGKLTGTQKVSFPAPKNKKESELFVEVTAEAGDGQKPNLLIDFKFERQAATYLGRGWTLGIDLGAEIATKDAAETNKLHVAYPFHRRWVFATGDGVAGVYGHFAPRIEADDVFANRNVLADVSFDLVTTRLAGGFGPPPSGAADLRLKYEISPKIGYQWGENQRLEDEKLSDLEGYSVSRAAAEVAFALKRELGDSTVKSFSFGVTYSGWYRFSEELDTFTNAAGKSEVRLEDGYVDYWKASLDLRLSDAFGIVLKYQTGERPVLFKKEDKASLGISYRL